MFLDNLMDFLQFPCFFRVLYHFCELLCDRSWVLGVSQIIHWILKNCVHCNFAFDAGPVPSATSGEAADTPASSPALILGLKSFFVLAVLLLQVLGLKTGWHRLLKLAPVVLRPMSQLTVFQLHWLVFLLLYLCLFVGFLVEFLLYIVLQNWRKSFIPFFRRIRVQRQAKGRGRASVFGLDYGCWWHSRASSRNSGECSGCAIL